MSNENEIDFRQVGRGILGILLIFSLVLIPGYIKNDILRHILVVLDLSILGVLACNHYSWVPEKKELKILFIVACVSGLYLPYLFTWIHELSHAFTTLFIDEIDFLGIKVDYPYGGIIHTRQPHLMFREDLLKFCCFNFSGSVGSVIIVLIFNRIIYHTKKIRFSWFLPLFITTTWWILHELCYWISGIYYYLDGIEVLHDAYKFLFYYHLIDNPDIPIDPLVLEIVVICLTILFLIWSVFNIRKRIKKIKKSEKENIVIID